MYIGTAFECAVLTSVHSIHMSSLVRALLGQPLATFENVPIQFSKAVTIGDVIVLNRATGWKMHEVARLVIRIDPNEKEENLLAFKSLLNKIERSVFKDAKRWLSHYTDSSVAIVRVLAVKQSEGYSANGVGRN